MKSLHIIVLAFTLLLSQWGTIDHVYHEHTAGEVCDFCISAKSFDHAVTSSSQYLALIKQVQSPEILAQASTSKTVIRHYSVRAPPRFI